MYICEQVGLIYQNEYNLAYKSSTESGAGTLLDNEDAFSEFIKDYQTMILGNKKVMVIVTLKKLSKKHSHQDEVSEQEESNDELENRTHFHQKTKSLPKKRAKNHIPKESNLDENEISRSLSLTSDHSLLSQISDYNLPKKVALNMKDFLGGLDKEFGDDKFTCYLPIFEEQEIRVSHLITLSDSEYILMDVTIIGRRQTLRNEAKKYE
ncbi:hypothetical protein RhiirB3_395248 [Rhizophagus irregularis]|nr:hypothetical protein RhiirB3_395248 [Rhizophagus irregularis]